MRNQPRIDISPHFVVFEDLPEPVVWSDYFGNPHPVELDIGCGKGQFVVKSCLENPDVNYVGIEIDYKKARHGALRLHKRDQPNGRFWGGDVHQYLDKSIQPNSLAAVHVYFPDPWWKRKHHKRRLFTEEFVTKLVEVLVPEGYLHFWTDVQEYWERTEPMMNEDERFLQLEAPEEKNPENDMDYQTSFERKKRKLGSIIYRGLWRLKPGV